MPGKANALTERVSAHLDMVRGLAALAVMAGHVRGLFLVDYPNLQSPSLTQKAIYSVTGFGHQAVMVFFVLSGFLIGGTVLNSIRAWSWKRYLINRFCRLYLVLLPALALTAVLDWVAYQQPGGHAYFDVPIPHFDADPLSAHRTLGAFVGNALFLQNIRVPTFGSDAPLWSLANEFWYYLLFPAVALALYSQEGLKRRLTSLLLLLAMGIFLPSWIYIGFAIWLLGVAIYVMPPLSFGSGLRWMVHVLTGGLFGAVLVMARLGRIPDFWSDPAVGFSFALWLFGLIKIKGAQVAIAPVYQWWARLLSKSSYSLYAVHLPFVILVRASLGTTLWLPSTGNLAIGFGLCIVTFLFGLGFSRLTEANNEAVRGMLFRAFAKPGVPSPGAAMKTPA